MEQVAVSSQINIRQTNTFWAEHTVVEMLTLLVHHVTSGLLKVRFRTHN